MKVGPAVMASRGWQRGHSHADLLPPGEKGQGVVCAASPKFPSPARARVSACPWLDQGVTMQLRSGATPILGLP